MNKINIIDIQQTCSACPSQWDFVTDDNRIGYVRYRWGGLSVRLSFKFDLIVDNTSIFDIIKFHYSEATRFFNFWSFEKKLIRTIPTFFEQGKLMFKDIYRYWLKKEGYNQLKSLNDIPKLFEFAGVEGYEILYEKVGDDFDGIIEWDEVWELLKDVDYQDFYKKLFEANECIDEHMFYQRFCEIERKRHLSAKRFIKKFKKKKERLK